MDERLGSDFAATLQTGFGDERSSDTRAEQIDVLVASLPLQDRKCKVTAQLRLFAKCKDVLIVEVTDLQEQENS